MKQPARIFVWSACVGLLFLTEARSEVSRLERLEDCLGPRAEAIALETWHNAPCQADQSCSTFELRLYASSSYTACAAESVLLCAVQEKEGRSECGREVARYLEAEINRVRLSLSREHLAHLAESTDGFAAHSIHRQAADLHNQDPIACPAALETMWPYKALDAGQACGYFRLVHRFSTARSIEDYMLQTEAEN